MMAQRNPQLLTDIRLRLAEGIESSHVGQQAISIGIPILLPEEVFRRMDQAIRERLTTRELGPVKVRGIEKEMRLTGVLA